MIYDVVSHTHAAATGFDDDKGSGQPKLTTVAIVCMSVGLLLTILVAAEAFGATFSAEWTGITGAWYDNSTTNTSNTRIVVHMSGVTMTVFQKEMCLQWRDGSPKECYTYDSLVDRTTTYRCLSTHMQFFNGSVVIPSFGFCFGGWTAGMMYDV